jgi:hypothetical protein
MNYYNIFKLNGGEFLPWRYTPTHQLHSATNVLDSYWSYVFYNNCIFLNSFE